MIRNQWYAILDSRQVRPGRPVGVTRMGEKLVAWRDSQGRVTVMQDLCPHRGVALSAGALRGDCIECPFHGFQFDASGRCTLIPANGRSMAVPKAFKVNAYPTFEAHGFVFIWWGQPTGELAPPPWFDDIGDEFTCATATDRWKTHYSRAIENQLDVAHLPFVHHNTIGRGIGPVVDGPLTHWVNPDRFLLYVFNRQDDGSTPRKPDDLSRPDTSFWIEFIFPNLWQNHLGEKARIVVAFAPVDDENSVLYLRFYQKFVRTPVLRSLITRLSMPPNLFILHQDRRPVETEMPKRTTLKVGEKLVQADRPIVEYRRRREELIQAAEGARNA